MKLQLKEWKAKDISFKVKENGEGYEEEKNSFDLSMGHFFPKDQPKEFGIGLRVNINDNEFDLIVEMVFSFKLDREVDDEFKESDFIKINAPAIAFPYLRSFISNLTLQSGFPPIILPSVNFVQLAKEKTSK
ncbi:protein-export chaperone SecB [Bacteroides sp. UBA939]|uniref:protein-export chaperone SecB n=1 Tax=Bacteroides sp. UBA939 TaxID=1946092 RepID=UPI0025C0E17A|nr:protein-export chaperone SecB [Bacteroides sp. UBA939]